LYGLITLGTCDLTCGDSGSKIIGFWHRYDSECFGYIVYWIQNYENLVSRILSVRII
jgi:hypothetical protein